MNLREFAKGQDCAVRFPGCRNEVETVVLAHLPCKAMTGMGAKVPDVCGAHACDYCHRLIDNRSLSKSERELRDELREFGEFWEYLYLALMRTLVEVTKAGKAVRR